MASLGLVGGSGHRQGGAERRRGWGLLSQACVGGSNAACAADGPKPENRSGAREGEPPRRLLPGWGLGPSVAARPCPGPEGSCRGDASHSCGPEGRVPPPPLVAANGPPLKVFWRRLPRSPPFRRTLFLSAWPPSGEELVSTPNVDE